MKKGDILSLSKGYEVTWKDGYPIKIQLTSKYAKGWNFKVLEFSDLDHEEFKSGSTKKLESPYLGFGYDELEKYYIAERKK